jgi:FKBP-type peptidyl-prolyl cis-trans isomerase FkpA
MPYRNYIIALLLGAVLVGCAPAYIKEYNKMMIDKPTSQSLIDRNTILNHLKSKKLDYKHTDSGIFYTIEKAGNDEHPKPSSNVIVNYKGYLLDGKQFDASEAGKPVSFDLQNLIKGWQEAIPMLGIGGKGTFIVPSEIAYGSSAKGDIPANSVLAFDIELVDINTPERQAAKEQQMIANYIKEHNLQAKKTDSGIYYVMEKTGDGEQPNAQSTVTVHYRGTLLDGKEFDSSYKRNQPATFNLRGLIKGWQEVIPMLKTGGKGTFIIPSSLAYGSADKGSIPPNSPLVFDIELLDIYSPEKQAQKEAGSIADYVAKKGLKAQKTPSGIFYVIEKAGSGKNPTIDSKVKVHYRGTLLDGSEFDSSYKRNEPIEFPLSGVIKGWQEAVPLLKPGGKGTFIIPSELAYGARALPGIPANSVLVFDVELLEVK